jgi:Plasmid pRiA4b ORF-3-like protein
MANTIYELKIQLDNVSKPPIWRKVQVVATTTLDTFHDIIQTAMGWEHAHLWQFMVNNDYYTVINEWSDGEDASEMSLQEALRTVGSKIRYEYDFGDGWLHTITLEKISEPITGRKYPYLVDGKSACPPEDCGGPWGYENLKATLADPTSKDYEDMCDWLGLDEGSEFNPKEFDIEYTRAMLR